MGVWSAIAIRVKRQQNRKVRNRSTVLQLDGGPVLEQTPEEKVDEHQEL